MLCVWKCKGGQHCPAHNQQQRGRSETALPESIPPHEPAGNTTLEPDAAPDPADEPSVQECEVETGPAQAATEPSSYQPLQCDEDIFELKVQQKKVALELCIVGKDKEVVAFAFLKRTRKWLLVLCGSATLPITRK